MTTNAYDLVRERYGVDTADTENPEAIDADTAEKVVFRYNPNRVALFVINLSANNVYIARTQSVSSSSGIFLTPNGGSITMNVRDDFLLPTLEWWIEASSNNSAIYSMETLIK